jgi:arginine deiminase
MTPSRDVHSEIGRPRQVMVRRPGLAQKRLTPANCRELLFDDVPWVAQVRNDHDAFTSAMIERDVEVLELHDLLATTVTDATARAWVLDRKLAPDYVDVESATASRPWLDKLPPMRLAEFLMGGVTRADLPFEAEGLLARCADRSDLLPPPLPNTLFARDSTCWIGDAAVLCSMFWPARRQETLLTTAVYRFHPMFAGQVTELWGDPDVDHGLACIEGGDVMVLGQGIVVIGMGERTTPQAVSQLARGLFAAGAATQVLAAQLPKSRGTMHLDTVSTMCDVNLVTVFPDGVDAIRVHNLRPGPREGSLDLRTEPGRVSRRGGDRPGPGQAPRCRDGWRCVRVAARAVGRRQQPAGHRAGGRHGLQPRQLHEHAAAQVGRRGHHHPEWRTRPRTGRQSLHGVPHRPRSAVNVAHSTPAGELRS